MPDIKFGAVGLNNVVYSTGNYAATNPSIPQNLPGQIISARVKKIILDNKEGDLFNKFGGWDSIGVIFWEPIDKPLPGSNYDANSFALPIFPNIKQYPLINEIVYLVQLTNNKTNENLTSNNYYYFPPLNIWQSQQHNAFPSFDNDPSQTMPRATYNEAFQGFNPQPENDVSKLNLGNTFKEKSNLHPLLPYEGDTIYEGRFGNSIRFGSTVKNAVIPNTWSSTGENGDPITIIRNGQADYNSEPWEPVTEQVNGDQSSIWLTSNQKLPISPGSDLGESFAKSTLPQSVNQYDKNQIVLNSGRLVFNSKTDSIILGSNQSIHLTAEKTVGIDGGNQIVLSAPKVYLGSAQGTKGTDIQSAVLGDDLNNLLGDIATFLSTLNIAFSTATDSMGVPIASLSTIAADAQTLSQEIQQQVSGKTLLSKQVKIS